MPEGRKEGRWMPDDACRGGRRGRRVSRRGLGLGSDPSPSPCPEPFGFAQDRLRRMDQDDNPGSMTGAGSGLLITHHSFLVSKSPELSAPPPFLLAQTVLNREGTLLFGLLHDWLRG